jgi:hypothetical protein
VEAAIQLLLGESPHRIILYPTPHAATSPPRFLSLPTLTAFPSGGGKDAALTSGLRSAFMEQRREADWPACVAGTIALAKGTKQERLEALFQFFDRDRDGQLVQREMCTLLQALAPAGTERSEVEFIASKLCGGRERKPNVHPADALFDEMDKASQP